MKEFTVLSPAKINLNLRVIGPREDGLHDMESVVQPVGIFDEVCLRISKKGGISLKTESPASIPESGGNTAFIAADMFMKEAGIACGVEIFIRKNIPAGAGLGGGSGNAAAVLAGLNRFFRIFSEEELRKIGRKIGADVPLFIGCRACRVWGTGEKVEPINDFPLFFYVVCFPGFESGTADVYGKWDSLNIHKPTLRREKKFWNIGGGIEMMNDLEPAAFSLYPGLARLRAAISLRCGVPFLMTGSGSAFFSVFEKGVRARHVFEMIRGSAEFECFLVRGIEGWREKSGRGFSAGL